MTIESVRGKWMVRTQRSIRWFGRPIESWTRGDQDIVLGVETGGRVKVGSHATILKDGRVGSLTTIGNSTDEGRHGGHPGPRLMMDRFRFQMRWIEIGTIEI